VPLRIAFAEIITLGEETLCGVVVSIKDDRGEMQLAGSFGDIVTVAATRQEKREGETKADI
jgi:hypothetical protein